MGRRGFIILGMILLLASLGLMTGLIVKKGPSFGSDLSGRPLVDEATLASLPKKSASTADFSHIDPSVMPPTNSWISGLVLHEKPYTIYPKPISYRGQNKGFEIGLPPITSQPEVISGQHVPGIIAAIDSAVGFKLERFDKISATLRYDDAERQALGRITLAEGVPYVFYEASNPSKITLSGAGESITVSDDRTYVRYNRQGVSYAVKLRGGKITAGAGQINVSLDKGGLATFYALPGENNQDRLQKFALNQVRSVEIRYKDKGESYITTLDYKTRNNEPTVVAKQAYQQGDSLPHPLVSYDSIFGKMEAYETNVLSVSSHKIEPAKSLNLHGLDDDQKSELISQLAKDAGSTVIDKTDSYFAGKQLARAATLLELAEQLKQPEIAKTLKQKLKVAFESRLDGNYFYYDTDLKGVAAANKAFGSEDFNDHHFHYGYFIYAASILGEYDKNFLDQNKAFVNLLVADIASYDQTTEFPLQRNYDPHAGHSWAAGLAPFDDGNNQESSSEAVNAWNAVGLWGKLTDNPKLTQTAEWMLSNEMEAASKAWRNVGSQDGSRSDYISPLVGINFGGKRVYATFFSNHPSAKLGIQLIPMTPVMKRFEIDGQAISDIVTASNPGDNFIQPLADYNLMYLALQERERAQKLLLELQNSAIDDGNSRAYLMAWILSPNN